MDRYKIERIPGQDGWWTITDTERRLECRFRGHMFTDTRTAAFIGTAAAEKHDARETADIMAGIEEWGTAYHHEVLMPLPSPTPRQRIGMMLAYKRRQAGLSVRELARRSGVTYSNISKIEQGVYNASVDVLSKILCATGSELAIVPSLITI